VPLPLCCCRAPALVLLWQYGLAEDTAKQEKRSSNASSSAASFSSSTPATPPAHQEIYSQSAVYIASAHSLKPDYPVSH